MDDKLLAVLLDKRGMAVSTISLAAMRDAAALGMDRERERCAEIALAINSGRGNEKEIAHAIRNPVTS